MSGYFCQCKTLAGEQCRTQAQEGSSFCWRHQDCRDRVFKKTEYVSPQRKAGVKANSGSAVSYSRVLDLVKKSLQVLDSDSGSDSDVAESDENVGVVDDDVDAFRRTAVLKARKLAKEATKKAEVAEAVVEKTIKNETPGEARGRKIREEREMAKEAERKALAAKEKVVELENSSPSASAPPFDTSDTDLLNFPETPLTDGLGLSSTTSGFGLHPIQSAENAVESAVEEVEKVASGVTGAVETGASAVGSVVSALFSPITNFFAAANPAASAPPLDESDDEYETAEEESDIDDDLNESRAERIRKLREQNGVDTSN